MDLRTVSQGALDALREICNVGGGNAATALSRMTGGRQIEMHVPRVFVSPFANVPALVGGSETPVVGVFQELSGASGGAVMLILGGDNARLLATAMGVNVGTGDALSESARDAVCEAATIISGAFLTAVAAFVKVEIMAGVPQLAEDMAGAVIDTVLCEIGRDSDAALILETEFCDRSRPYRGLFLLLPSLTEWFKALAASR